jgi:putative endonuclease
VCPREIRRYVDENPRMTHDLVCRVSQPALSAARCHSEEGAAPHTAATYRAQPRRPKNLYACGSRHRPRHTFLLVSERYIPSRRRETRCYVYENPGARVEHNYYVYILSSTHGVLYVGMTNDLIHGVAQHKQRKIPGFSKRYNVDRLVYFEHTHDVEAAIAREKQIKGWTREKKAALIESRNPQWVDLYPGLLASPDEV